MANNGELSPIIANVYLHYVLDEWFVKEVQPRLKGRCFLIRFADDAVLGLEYEEDARRVREVLFKRLEKYGLKAHAEKTRLVKFTRTPSGGKKDVSNGTFDFLGFTHYWTKSRKGYWVVHHSEADATHHQPVYTVVSLQPAFVGERTMSETQSKVERLLSVFWDTRKL